MSFIEIQDAQTGFEAYETPPNYDFPELSMAMQQKYISLSVACYWIASEGRRLTIPLNQEAMEAAWVKLCGKIVDRMISIKGANLSGAAPRLLPQDSLSAFDVLPAEFIHPSDENYIFKSAWVDDDVCLDEAHVEIFYPESGSSRDALINPRDPQNQWFELNVKATDILAVFNTEDQFTLNVQPQTGTISTHKPHRLLDPTMFSGIEHAVCKALIAVWGGLPPESIKVKDIAPKIQALVERMPADLRRTMNRIKEKAKSA